MSELIGIKEAAAEHNVKIAYTNKTIDQNVLIYTSMIAVTIIAEDFKATVDAMLDDKDNILFSMIYKRRANFKHTDYIDIVTVIAGLDGLEIITPGMAMIMYIDLLNFYEENKRAAAPMDLNIMYPNGFYTQTTIHEIVNKLIKPVDVVLSNKHVY